MSLLSVNYIPEFFYKQYLIFLCFILKWYILELFFLIENTLVVFYQKHLTSPTLCCLYESCLEHSLWPWSGYETVGVSNHRKHHGWGGVNFSIISLYIYLAWLIVTLSLFDCVYFRSDAVPNFAKVNCSLKIQNQTIITLYIFQYKVVIKSFLIC